MLLAHPLNKVHKAVIPTRPSPKPTLNTTMQQCRQLEKSFVQEQTRHLDQSNDKTNASVNEIGNIINESVKDTTATNDDMDYVKTFISTKIEMIDRKTKQINRILDEIQSTNQTFLIEQFVDEHALTTIRLESNNCKKLDESKAIPKLLELEQQLLSIETNCNSMKITFENQKILDANQSGAFNILLGLDPTKPTENTHRSTSETSSFRYQELSQTHNRTVQQNQNLQLSLANTTKALERSNNDNKEMSNKINKLEEQMQTILDLQRRQTENSDYNRSQNSSRNENFDFMKPQHKEYDSNQTTDNTDIHIEPTANGFNESINKKDLGNFAEAIANSMSLLMSKPSKGKASTLLWPKLLSGKHNSNPSGTDLQSWLALFNQTKKSNNVDKGQLLNI